MTLTEFEQLTVEKVFMGDTHNGLQLMSIETKDGQTHNFFLPVNMEVAHDTNA